LQLQLNNKIAKLGQSDISKKAGVETNSSSVQKAMSKAEKQQQTEKLPCEIEAEETAEQL